MRRTKNNQSLSDQLREHANSKDVASDTIDFSCMISTGSTLLNLAISGSVCHEGGIPGGVVVEVSGPPSCGKTVLLCEIAGAVQRKGGQIKFFDPEGRLNKHFAKLFDLQVKDEDYEMPDTVPEIFKPIREWHPEPIDTIHGIFADSLAALSTDMEMADTDKYGMRRAKEFSEQLRKTCRVITKKQFLMVCSNQVRENVNATQWEPKFRSTGGMGIPYYSSIRLQCRNPQKIRVKKSLDGGKETSRVIGVTTTIEVIKNSVDAPYRTAEVMIDFSYGIDDIKVNLQYLKDNTKETQYMIGKEKLSKSLDHACRIVEKENMEIELRKETIRLWHEIEERFMSDRKPKVRY